MSDLRQTFQSMVADQLRPLPLAEMPHMVYELLHRFENECLPPTPACEDTTFGQLGFSEGNTPRALYLPLEESQEWVPCGPVSRPVEWTVLPLRELTRCERILPAIGSALLGAGFPTQAVSDSLWQDTVHHFRSAAANIRAQTVGLGFSTDAIPGARRTPSEYAIPGQLMKLALIKL